MAIDPAGPVDPAVPDPQPVEEISWSAAFTLMAPGWYPPEHAITQAHGFCFTPDGLVVLGQVRAGPWNLRGGQLEGETPPPWCVRSPRRPAPG